MNRVLIAAVMTILALLKVDGKPVCPGKRYGDIMHGENSKEHEHSEQDMPSDDEGSEDAAMTEDDLMKSIEETMKSREKQRAFWDQELKEMNYWLKL